MVIGFSMLLRWRSSCRCKSQLCDSKKNVASEASVNLQTPFRYKLVQVSTRAASASHSTFGIHPHLCKSIRIGSITHKWRAVLAGAGRQQPCRDVERRPVRHPGGEEHLQGHGGQVRPEVRATRDSSNPRFELLATSMAAGGEGRRRPAWLHAGLEGGRSTLSGVIR